MKKNSLLKLLLLLIIIIASFLIIRFLPMDRVRDIIAKSGSLAPVVYILMFSLLPIAFFPVPVLALAGGWAFGLIDGTIYTLIGAAFNCSIEFYIARYIGRDYVTNLINKKVDGKIKEKFNNSSSKKLFSLILILRLIPLVPYDLINYGSGLTNVDFKYYISATMLGILPGTVIYLNVGDKATNVRSMEFVGALVLLALLIIVSITLSKYYNKGDKK